MRAAVFLGPGQPLRIQTVRKPRPRRGEVLVEVHACGLCHTDLHVLLGEVAFPVPAVLGHEIAGRVAELGEGVEGLALGDPVVGTFIMPCGCCRYCYRGRDDLCETFFHYNRLHGRLYDGETRLFTPDGQPLAMYSMGGFAEYAVVPATAVYRLPDSLPLVPSAILGCAVMTAYGAVRHGGAIRPGDSVAVVAVGGVGLNMVQWARVFGASQVVAVDVSLEKLDLARRLGATDGVVAGPDAAQRVRALTGGGVDVALEALGRPETVSLALQIVRDGGRVVLVGLAPQEVTAPLPITHMVRRSLQVVGSYGTRVRQDMPTLLRLVASGAIDVAGAVTRTYRFEAINEAFADLQQGRIPGRAVLHIRPPA